MTPVSDIKLIRTDTTLDLSQKAEKGMKFLPSPCLLIPFLPPLTYGRRATERLHLSTALADDDRCCWSRVTVGFILIFALIIDTTARC